MDRNFGQGDIGWRRRRSKRAAARENPGRLGHFMGFGQQHDGQTEEPDEQHDTD